MMMMSQGKKIDCVFPEFRFRGGRGKKEGTEAERSGAKEGGSAM